MPPLRLRPLLLVFGLPLLVYILFHSSSTPTASFSPLQKLLPDGIRGPVSPVKTKSWSGHKVYSGLNQGFRETSKGGTVSKPNRFRLLVTGGAGELAQAIVPHLLSSHQQYSLILVDDLPSPFPADYYPSRLQYTQTSSSTTFEDVFRKTSPSIDGILHLASLGPGEASYDGFGEVDMWCSDRAAVCESHNVEGTRRVLDALDNAALASRKLPWLIHASSTVSHTVLGQTLAKAEALVEASTTVDAIVLRLGTVYGGIAGQGPISQLLQHALVSLPIQLSPFASEPTLNLVHVRDAAAAFEVAIERLANDQGASVSAFDIASGQGLLSEDQVAKHVITLINSQSPVRYLEDVRPHTSTDRPLHPLPSEQDLAWTPQIGWEDGLGLALNHLRSLTVDWSRQYLEDSCNTPSHQFEALGLKPADPYSHLRMVEADERNQHLDRLDGCTVNLGVNNQGYIHHIKCSQEIDGGGSGCRADGERVTAMNWNASVFIIHLDQGDGIRPKKSWSLLGTEKPVKNIRIRFEDEKGAGALGYRPSETLGNGTFHLGLSKPEDRVAADWQGVFDTYVQGDASNLRLVVPNTRSQIKTQPNATDDSTSFYLANPSEAQDFNLRMTVLCCPREGGWPLLLDDYESSDMRFGSTGVIPFNASRRVHVCDRVERSVMGHQHALKAAQAPLDESKGKLSAQRPLTAPSSHLPHKWSLKGLPPCWNDCSSPLICVKTDECQCVQSDSCPPRENPLVRAQAAIKKAAHKSHLGQLAGPSETLVNTLKTVDWRDILLPEARAALLAHPDFIKLHVVTGYDNETVMEAADCHKLQSTHCFSADNIMYRAMRQLSTTAEEADLIVVPVYQHCQGVQFLLHKIMKFASDYIPKIKTGEKPVALMLTHDWGICIEFAWEIWSARDQHKLFPDWILNNVIVWSVMGDFDSPCYRPHQDIVVPARTCRSITLRDAFGDVAKVKPSGERPHLLTWSGTYWGTGKSTRLRLTCERGGAGETELIEGGGPQSSWLSWSYMDELNNARFCPQPRGIAGWSPRVSDALFAGCIPVFIAEGTHYPFADMLDWSQLSVRVGPTELDHIEDILAAIPLAEVELMQAKIMAVREAFIYSTDEAPEEELQRRGPMFFALHAASMRLRTKYPVAPKATAV